jgi:hypothetical protein
MKSSAAPGSLTLEYQPCSWGRPKVCFQNIWVSRKPVHKALKLQDGDALKNNGIRAA